MNIEDFRSLMNICRQNDRPMIVCCDGQDEIAVGLNGDKCVLFMGREVPLADVELSPLVITQLFGAAAEARDGEAEQA
ncbi:MAG: hypothetical protein ACOY5R_06760 [Pseudomonadota bacterium]